MLDSRDINIVDYNLQMCVFMEISSTNKPKYAHAPWLELSQKYEELRKKQNNNTNNEQISHNRTYFWMGLLSKIDMMK